MKWHHLTSPRSHFQVLDFSSPAHIFAPEEFRAGIVPVPTGINSNRSNWWLNKGLKSWQHIVGVNNTILSLTEQHLHNVPQLIVFQHPLGKQIERLHSYFQKNPVTEFSEDKATEWNWEDLALSRWVTLGESFTLSGSRFFLFVKWGCWNDSKCI